MLMTTQFKVTLRDPRAVHPLIMRGGFVTHQAAEAWRKKHGTPAMEVEREG
jgi:hypothetical protein